MKRYYLVDPNNTKSFVEVTEAEYTALIGDSTARPYATKVYQDKMSIEDVPENIRSQVQAVVDARIARFGAYADIELTAREIGEEIKKIMPVNKNNLQKLVEFVRSLMAH